MIQAELYKTAESQATNKSHKKQPAPTGSNALKTTTAASTIAAAAARVDEDCSKLLQRLRKLGNIEREPEPEVLEKVMGNKKLAGLIAKGKKGKYNEQAKAAFRELTIINNTKLEVVQVQDMIELLSDLVDERGEISKAFLPGSWIEREINQRHLLEAAVLQRTRLIPPQSLRAAKAYISVPLTKCSPTSLSATDLKFILEHKGYGDYTVKKFRGWEVYYPSSVSFPSASTITAANSNAFTSALRSSASFSATAVGTAGADSGATLRPERPTSAGGGGGRANVSQQAGSTPVPGSNESFVYHVHKKSGVVQVGEPFDLTFHYIRRSLKEEMW